MLNDSVTLRPSSYANVQELPSWKLEGLLHGERAADRVLALAADADEASITDCEQMAGDVSPVLQSYR